MTQQYDTIVIGGGHNGLVTAVKLAKAGQKVLVLEKRATVGGAATTEELFPGFQANVGAPDANLLADETINDLALSEQGVTFVEPDVAVFAPTENGRALTLYRDDSKTQTALAAFSAKDAEKYPQFAQQVRQYAGILKQMMALTPPDLTRLSLGELPGWGKVGLNVKRMGSRPMMELIRLLPMGLADYLNEWFETDLLKGALAGYAIIGQHQGPRSMGTVLTFLYQQTGGFLRNRFVKGGMGTLMAGLAAEAAKHGAEIRTNAPVAHILVEDNKVAGVQLASGERITAKNVASSADPVHTFMHLVGPQQLEPRFMRQVRHVMMRGSTAQVILALDGLPEFRGQEDVAQLMGHIRFAPSLDYVEKAYDAVKYGRISTAPYLDATIPTLHDASLAPAGHHLMTVTMRYAPYRLRDGGWDERKEALGDLVVDTLAKVAPNLPSLIAHRHVMTPLDLEREFGLTEGAVYHGQMGLDQLLVMRPVPGYGRYRTPIQNLYLCGAGAHPGGGITGLPGSNAAREILSGS